MGRIIKTWRDPYDRGFSTCFYKEISIRSGITILVGCNGFGKTTLINNIEEELRKDNIPYLKYDKLHQEDDSFSFSGEMNIEKFALRRSSSEGENINIDFSSQLQGIREFLETGRVVSEKTKFVDLFRQKEYEIPETKERWLLYDAIDSGWSIDNVIDAKWIFNDLIKRAEQLGYTLYIVISANSYELAQGMPCMDVSNGKYMKFYTYEDYRKFILKSRKKRDKRYENEDKRNENNKN